MEKRKPGNSAYWHSNFGILCSSSGQGVGVLVESGTGGLAFSLSLGQPGVLKGAGLADPWDASRAGGFFRPSRDGVCRFSRHQLMTELELIMARRTRLFN